MFTCLDLPQPPLGTVNKRRLQLQLKPWHLLEGGELTRFWKRVVAMLDRMLKGQKIAYLVHVKIAYL